MSTQTTDQQDPDELPVSKSERKREMTALQKLGEDLMTLPAGQFSKLPLSARLREAIELAKNLKQREARRRQLQYVGKLMRSENRDEIVATLAGFEADNRYFRQHFKRLEIMRDKLIADGDQELTQLLSSHPELDRQHMRQLIRQARKQTSPDKISGTSRKLFTYLRTTLLPEASD